MPVPSKGPRLGGSPQHERLILRNLAQSLFEHGKIKTTTAKAKRLRPFAEKLITTAKRGDLHARREILKVIRDKNVVHTLFAEIAPSFETRNGGYTRIIKTLARQGDNAPMAIIELVKEETVSSAANRVTRRAAGTTSNAARPKQAKKSDAAVADETAVDETATDETATDEVVESDAAEDIAADEVVDADEVAASDEAVADEVASAEGTDVSADEDKK